MVLPPGELAALQTAMLDTLPLFADIQRNQSATIVIGQRTETWQSILPGGVPVSCGMKQPSQAQAQIYANLIGTKQATVFTFGSGQAILRNDRVIEGGITWTVQAVLTPQSYPVDTQVLATRIG